MISRVDVNVRGKVDVTAWVTRDPYGPVVSSRRPRRHGPTAGSSASSCTSETSTRGSSTARRPTTESIFDTWKAVPGPARLHAGRQRVDRLPQGGRGRRTHRPHKRLRRRPTRWATPAATRSRNLDARPLDLLRASRRDPGRRTRGSCSPSGTARRPARTASDGKVRRERDLVASPASSSSRSTCPADPTTTQDLWYGAASRRTAQNRSLERTGADLRWLDTAFACRPTRVTPRVS